MAGGSRLPAITTDKQVLGVLSVVYEEVTWRCDGRDLQIGLDRPGRGPTVLLLPALSSISTRCEMHALQERLSVSFSTVSIDWPGFGALPKPYVDWRPEIYEAYLAYLLAQVVPNPVGIVAAGHAAGYVLKHCATHENAARRLVLLSPTWRGPLPTMTGGRHALFAKIAKAFDPPVFGALLYELNVNRVVIGMMARGHVYAEPSWLTRNRMEGKLAVTRTRGARYASARFVSGYLDPFESRAQQTFAAKRVAIPMLNMFAASAPAKSRLEMEAFASLPNVETVQLGRGKLSFYEECAEETAVGVRKFLEAAVQG